MPFFSVALVALSLLGVPTPAPAVAPEFSGSVYAITTRGSVTYVGGSFTSVVAGGRSYARQRLAAFDSRTGTLLSWAPAADRTVRALAWAGTSIYAGGDFGRVSGERRDNLVKLDATTGSVGTLRHTISGAPYALAVGAGRLYMAGSFSAVDGDRRANLAAFSMADGALDKGWKPQAESSVHALAVSGTRVYAGGAFRDISRVARTARVAAVSATTGAVDGRFRATAPAQVNSLAVDNYGVRGATGGQGGRAIS